jgi:hypothetical protein
MAMRERQRSGVRAVVGAAAVVASMMAGCFDSFKDCVLSATCAPPDGGDGGGGDPACEGDPTLDAGLVSDACGVFVSASAAPGGDGTRARPLRSFVEAAAKRPRRVYACAETYAESAGVVFARGVEIYAGFTDCAGAWSWSAEARASLAGPADALALALAGGDHHVENLNVTAADAAAPGGSSIGMIVVGGTLRMRSGDVTAGAGRDGVVGGSLAADVALNGASGSSGSDACTGDILEGNAGGAAVTKTCDAERTVGGEGGDGGRVEPGSTPRILAGGDGEAGMPAGIGGQQGIGEPEAGAWGCFAGAGLGNGGAPGANGDPGAGASDNSLGEVTSAGFVGVAGAQGASGKPGQGGGGGGGAKGGRICTGSTYGFGASGGSGGSGGCGGRGGGGGGGGGASIAVVSAGASVTFEGVKITAGNGGKGGNGGEGQPGGTGGNAGIGGQPSGSSNPACDGGRGGKGGNGGPGGGRGGHAIGIAYTGSMPEGATITPGTAGEGGDGGPGNEMAGRGAPGLAAEAQAFE